MVYSNHFGSGSRLEPEYIAQNKAKASSIKRLFGNLKNI